MCTIVHFNHIWSILVPLSPFCLLWSYSVYFGSIWSIMSTFILFGPFGLIQSTLLLFGSVWFYSVHFVHFGSFNSHWFYWVHLILFGPYSSLWFSTAATFFFYFKLFDRPIDNNPLIDPFFKSIYHLPIMG